MAIYASLNTRLPDTAWISLTLIHFIKAQPPLIKPPAANYIMLHITLAYFDIYIFDISLKDAFERELMTPLQPHWPSLPPRTYIIFASLLWRWQALGRRLSPRYRITSTKATSFIFSYTFRRYSASWSAAHSMHFSAQEVYKIFDASLDIIKAWANINYWVFLFIIYWGAVTFTLAGFRYYHFSQ